MAANDIRALDRATPVEFLGRGDELGGLCAGGGCWLDVEPAPWVKGLVAGTWPPVTAAGVLTCLGRGGDPYEWFPSWNHARYRLSALVPPLDPVEYATALADVR
jgi:hypothetical protein